MSALLLCLCPLPAGVVISRVCSLKDYTTICSSAPSEVLALAGLRAWGAILARQLATVRSNLALAEAFFAKWAGVLAWEPPRAGTIAFPRLITGEQVDGQRPSYWVLWETLGQLLLHSKILQVNSKCSCFSLQLLCLLASCVITAPALRWRTDNQ